MPIDCWRPWGKVLGLFFGLGMVAPGNAMTIAFATDQTPATDASKKTVPEQYFRAPFQAQSFQPKEQLAASLDRPDFSGSFDSTVGDWRLDSPFTMPEIAQLASPAPSILPEQTTALPGVPTIAQIPTSGRQDLDLKPEIIENSPTLKRWLQKIPNLQTEIANDPSFQTRLRLGYTDFSNAGGGVSVGIEDVFFPPTRLTLSADYQTNFKNDRSSWGADLRYYLRPLGNRFNLAPIVGYRQVEIDRDTTSGLNLGLRAVFVLSRKGAADIALSQSWVAPTRDREVGLTTLSFGYAVTAQLRLSTEFQRQNGRQQNESRVGVFLEWMF